MPRVKREFSMDDLRQNVPEKVFQKQVLAFARTMGWEAHWTWVALHSPDGFPDLLLVRGERIVAAELKRPLGKVRPAQEQWLARLRATGKVEAYLWRNTGADWEEIERVLA
jgi:hypothetical protein